MATRKRN